MTPNPGTLELCARRFAPPLEFARHRLTTATLARGWRARPPSAGRRVLKKPELLRQLLPSDPGGQHEQDARKGATVIELLPDGGSDAF